MSIETSTAVLERTTELPPGHYSFASLLRSEWTKLRSVRSTWWTIGVTVLLGIGIGALVTAETRAHWHTMDPGSIQSFDPTASSLVGLFICQFAIGILGALVVSAEYSTGTIRATFSAAPHRTVVLAAKATVYGFVALVVSEFVSFVSFILGQFLLSAPATHATLSSPGALRAVVGGGLYICVLGLIAFGLAAIIRHTAGAISAFVGILLVLPLVVQALPSSLSEEVRKFLPDRIGIQMLTTNGGSFNAFTPWVGFGILCVYAFVLISIGAALMNRRDA
jgi:ABC-2 type transport system permease protein